VPLSLSFVFVQRLLRVLDQQFDLADRLVDLGFRRDSSIPYKIHLSLCNGSVMHKHLLMQPAV
jgi:hypothetical protein